jgi:hypothetical protein
LASQFADCQAGRSRILLEYRNFAGAAMQAG